MTAFIGAAWTLATAMTLPVLIVENVGAVEAISRGLDLLRRNWDRDFEQSVGSKENGAIGPEMLADAFRPK